MRLLYITRKFPPMVGGMEKLSFALSKEFPKHADTTLITWGKSQKFLPFVLPYFFFKALFLIPTKKINHIHLGDALLSPLGLVLKSLFNIRTTVTACGLDVTFKFPPYQMVVPRALKRLDKVICISNATLEECVKRGVPKEKCVMIPCGVYPEEFKVKATKKDLEKIVGQDLENKKIIITVGRLVERKGVYWFIKNVFPKLDKNFVYLVIGEGQERERIEGLIKNLNLENRVSLLGKISDQDLKIIYNTSDCFVMPNIKVNDDIEGFGIVAIEASSAGLPVIASNIDGVVEAVRENHNGWLVNEQDSSKFLQSITSYKINKNLIKNFITRTYSWNKISSEYIRYIR